MHLLQKPPHLGWDREPNQQDMVMPITKAPRDGLQASIEVNSLPVANSA
jgi:hypothetical protein